MFTCAQFLEQKQDMIAEETEKNRELNVNQITWQMIIMNQCLICHPVGNFTLFTALVIGQ